jgi:hypothetical protein
MMMIPVATDQRASVSYQGREEDEDKFELVYKFGANISAGKLHSDLPNMLIHGEING